MIPYSYKMVDMGGIDLAKDTDEPVSGIYSRIEEAMNDCGDVVLYNWKFAGIEISPQYVSILSGDPIIINEVINVYSNDIIAVTGVTPDPPVLVSLLATSNGQYSPLNYDADGFNEVEVAVRPPLEVLEVTQNNTEYLPSEGYYGFSKVIVAVPESTPVIYVRVQGGYNGGAIVTLTRGDSEIFRAVGDSPYNLNYSPNSGSIQVSGYTLNVSIPTLPSERSPLTIQLSWNGINRSVQFMYTGQNTSYGYGDQTSVVDFGQ